jgi:hypothetical protein
MPRLNIVHMASLLPLIPCNLWYNSNCLFSCNEEAGPKFIRKCKEPGVVQTNLKKKNKVGEYTHPN